MKLRVLDAANADDHAIKATPTGWFDLTDYDAKGDGVADDTTAISDAILAATRFRGGGGTIYCPRGVYRIDGQLPTLPVGVHLRGEKAHVFAPFQSGTVFETYRADTVLYLGEYNDFNWTTNSKVSNVLWHCKANFSASAWLKAIAGASNTSPIEITAAAHGFTTGDLVSVATVGGNTAANGEWAIVVTGVNTFTLTGSAGNAAYTTGGVAIDQRLFATGAGAALEARGTTNFDVEHCTFLAYPVGLLLDGAETGVIERCNFFGTQDASGYQNVATFGYGVWYTDGSQRGRGWTSGNSVNNHVLRDCVFGGSRTNLFINGGTSFNIADSNFEGGHTAIQLSGPNQVVIKRCTTEGYVGGEAVLVGPTNALQVTLENNSLDGAFPAIRVTGGVAMLNLFNNILGCDPANGYHGIYGSGLITQCNAINNWNQHPGRVFDAAVGGSGFYSNKDGLSTPCGVGVNKSLPATAGLDVVFLDPAKPAVRLADNTYGRYEEFYPTQQTSARRRHAVSSINGLLKSGVEVLEGLHFFFANDAAVDVVAFTPQDETTYKIDYTVVQTKGSNATIFAIWRRSQIATKHAGVVVLQDNAGTAGAVTELETIAGSLSGTTPPSFVVDGSGNVALRCYSSSLDNVSTQVRATIVAAAQ